MDGALWTSYFPILWFGLHAKSGGSSLYFMYVCVCECVCMNVSKIWGTGTWTRVLTDPDKPSPLDGLPFQTWQLCINQRERD